MSTEGTVVVHEIMDTPSRSKGWGRWQTQAFASGESVLRTMSGTKYGSGRVGDTRSTNPLKEGTGIDIVMEVELNIGRGPKRRRERSTRVYRMVVERDAICDLEYYPGSQGMRIRIAGARRVEGNG